MQNLRVPSILHENPPDSTPFPINKYSLRTPKYRIKIIFVRKRQTYLFGSLGDLNKGPLKLQNFFINT